VILSAIGQKRWGYTYNTPALYPQEFRLIFAKALTILLETNI